MTMIRMLEELRSRVDRCRAAAVAGAGLAVEIGPPLALSKAPADAPPAAVAAYRLFEYVAGPLFRFDCPDELRSIEAWQARPGIEMLLPMPIDPGWEMWSWQSITKGRLGVRGGETLGFGLAVIPRLFGRQFPGEERARHATSELRGADLDGAVSRPAP